MAFGTDGNVLTDSPIVFSNSTLLSCPSSSPCSRISASTVERPLCQGSLDLRPSRQGLFRAKQASCSKDEIAYSNLSNSTLLSCPSSSPCSRSSTSAVERPLCQGSLDLRPSRNGLFPAKQASCRKDEVAYDNWKVQYPSALDTFDQMMAESKGKRIVVFLDYDGTLSPIVDDPDEAYMLPKMRSAVRAVAKYFPTAIISGRCLDKVYNFVKLAELYYAGSHGMDIKGPATMSRGSKASYGKTTDKKGDDVLLYQPASEFLPMMDKIFASLVEKMKTIDGAAVENNKFCVSVHYRRVQQKSWNALEEQIQSVIRDYPGIRLTEGKMVIEIRPPIKWDKGKALEYLLQSLGLANSNDVLPVYIGDDRTDEDAFKVLQKRGQGYGILVSTTPKETSANFSLKEPLEVMNFLNRLVKWKQRQLNKVRPSRV